MFQRLSDSIAKPLNPARKVKLIKSSMEPQSIEESLQGKLKNFLRTSDFVGFFTVYKLAYGHTPRLKIHL